MAPESPVLLLKMLKVVLPTPKLLVYFVALRTQVKADVSAFDPLSELVSLQLDLPHQDVEHLNQLPVLEVVDGQVDVLDLRIGLPHEIVNAEELADLLITVSTDVRFQ